MSNSRLDNTTAINEGKELNKHQSDEDLLTKTHKMQAEGATLIEKEDLNQAKNIDLDRTSEIVEALEQELSERKKQIVTSFQLQELSHSSRAQRRSSVKSNIVIWTRAEQHFSLGSDEQQDDIKSISSLTKAISLKPTECKYYIKRGEKFLQLCDFQSAILNYKKACILDPDNDQYYSRLASIYYMKGQCLFDCKNYTDALECFSRAAEMKPDVIGYHTRSVACLAALHRHGECLALVNKRLNVENDNADLLIMRARLHLLFRNDSLSYYDVMDALKLNPEHSEAQIMLTALTEKAENFKEQGVKLQLLGKTQEALLKFSNATESNPGCAEYHIFRGALYRQLSDFNSAIDDYLVAMDKKDHDYSNKVYKEAQRQLLLCYNDFAVECFSKGFYDEAVVLLNKAIKEEKNEKGLYINRGDCFFRMFEFDFALSDYNQGLELDGKDSSIKVRLSVVFNELGLLSYADKRYVQAFEYFDLAIQHNPKVAVYYTSRARARYMLEDYEGAKYDVTCCLSLEPSNRSCMSLFTRLYPDKGVEDVLRSSAGILAAQSVQEAISEVFPFLWSNYSMVELRDNVVLSIPSGSKDLAVRSVLPPISQPKLAMCLNEKDFNVNYIDRKLQSSKKVKKAFDERKSLEYKGPKISTESIDKSVSTSKECFKFGKGGKPSLNQRTRIKVRTKRIAFMQA